MSRPRLIHVIADCTVCGKHWANYITGHSLAKAHAKKTGHKVIVDLGYVAQYGNRPNQKANHERRKR